MPTKKISSKMLDLTERNTVTFILCIIFLSKQRNINFKNLKGLKWYFMEKKYFLELISTSLFCRETDRLLSKYLLFLSEDSSCNASWRDKSSCLPYPLVPVWKKADKKYTFHLMISNNLSNDFRTNILVSWKNVILIAC